MPMEIINKESLDIFMAARTAQGATVDVPENLARPLLSVFGNIMHVPLTLWMDKRRCMQERIEQAHTTHDASMNVPGASLGAQVRGQTDPGNVCESVPQSCVTWQLFEPSHPFAH